MAINAREGILEALKTLFETITIANGYQNDIGLVSRRIMSFDQIAVNETPALFIFDDGNEEVLNYNTDDATVRSTISLKVVGLVRDEDETALSTSFNKFKADFEKLLWGNNYLPSTQADDMRLTAYEDITTAPPWLIFTANLRFNYWFRRADP